MRRIIMGEYMFFKQLERYSYILIILLVMQFQIYAQKRHIKDESVKPDSVLSDSSYHIDINLKTLSPKPVRSSHDLNKIIIDTSISDEDILNNSLFTIPTPFDTTNKIRLPISQKKDKFAYFDASQSIDRIIPNDAFDVGEKLDFIVRYGPIKAGSATMSIPKLVNLDGYESYKVVTEARSSAFFSAFFKVRDRVESYMDRDGLFTWRFEKHLREGKYRANQVVLYDQINGWAVQNKKDSLRIPPCVQDVLSSFYYVRTQDLEVGESLFIDNHADNKLYPLEVKVHKKEKIKVKAGEFNCFVVEPILRSGGIFKKKGRLLIWLTDDENKIPVQMKSKILIGYITAELKKMEGIKKNKHVRLRPN